MENFAGSLLPVEIEQGSLKPNYGHKVRTRRKRSPRMKLFSPKFRTWIGQWNVRTLYESGKVAQLAAEMGRYRLEILGVSEARWNQFGETELIRKAQSTFSMLMPVWKEKCIRLQTKLRIFNTNVKSAPLYGSETTDQEIANLYQQVFKEDPEHPLARGHFKRRPMGKDTKKYV